MKNLRKILAAIISAVLIFSLCSCTAAKKDDKEIMSDSASVSETYIPIIIPEGEGNIIHRDALTPTITWTLYENGHLEINGIGDMPDLDMNGTAYWQEFRTNIRTVNIGEGITKIGAYSFVDCCNITYFVIPDTVTHIGAGAFRYCTGIQFLGIPESVTQIGNVAFLDWTDKQSVFFENPKETYLAYDETFCWYSDCEKYYDYDLSQGYLYIPVFEGILHEGELTKNVDWAFYGTGELVISGKGDMPDWETEKYAPWYEFNDDIVKITVEEGIKTIGESAFANCHNVEEVNLPESLERINDEAFFECGNFEQFTIPANITYVGDCVFSDCENLTDIFVEHSEEFVAANWPEHWAGETDAEIIYTK